jgi:hypothetical protein
VSTVSAAANSAVVAYRSAGAFASARWSAAVTPDDTAGRSSVTGRGVTFRCWCARLSAVAAANGGTPASISYSTQPSE